MRRIVIVILLLLAAVSAAVWIYFAIVPRPAPTRREAIGQVSIFAGSGMPAYADGAASQAAFADPFGLVFDEEGGLLVADGGAANRICRITASGMVETLAGGEEGFADGAPGAARFNTPSGMARDGEGAILIADTANHRIRKLEIGVAVTTVAGSGAPGFQDGPAATARFDGPMGLAVDEAGNIYVADAYNDRIRKISPDGQVTTLAGTGQPGFVDGAAHEARFDTPCGVAVDAQGNVDVADTGNGRIRRITPDGQVTTLEGEPLREPTGILATHDGYLFVSEAGGGRIRRITPEGEIETYAGGRTGFADGAGEAARFNMPAGLAVDLQGNVYVADARNYLVRRVAPVEREAAGASEAPAVFIQPIQPGGERPFEAAPRMPRLDLSAMAEGGAFPWPLDPQDGWHEVTGVVGEARGAPGGVALHHLHSGLDMRGNLGDPVRSILNEKVSAPLPNWGFESGNEGLTVGLVSYIHMRVGRDKENRLLSAERFKPRYDEAGQLTGVRVRRGTRFAVGEVVGTLNRLYHVHLNIGPWNAQENPIELPFPGLTDGVVPVVEEKGIEIVDAAGKPFMERRDGRLVIHGDVDIVVTAYDRADGNAARRKLGLYRIGYQVLKADGSPVAGFEEPLFNIEFNRLPPDDESVFVVYAAGSGVSAYGQPTRFRYIVTNLARDGMARDGLLRTGVLEPGAYVIRVYAEDRAGNRASGKGTELPVLIEAR